MSQPQYSPDSYILITNTFLDKLETHKSLGQPILEALPHPKSSNRVNPILSQILLSYSTKPEARECISFGNGPLDKLLRDKNFKKHIIEHVRKVTKLKLNSKSPRSAEYEFTEYVLGPNGNGRIIPGYQIEKLCPEVREVLENARAAERRVPQRRIPCTAPSKPMYRTELSSSPNDIAKICITRRAAARLDRRYKECGDPIFSKTIDHTMTGPSDYTLTFSKLPREKLELRSGLDFDWTASGAVEGEEEIMIQEATRQVTRFLMLGWRAKRRPEKESTAEEEIDMDKVDQEIEAAALESRYWSCLEDISG